MKKNDDLRGSRTDDEEVLFDLSLDDLEPEDTIFEDHVDEADEEIIELIDLVEKGDIELAEEERGQSSFLDTIQELAEDEGDELKTDKTLDLLNIPLDQDLVMDNIDEFKEDGEGMDALEIADSDIFMENKLDSTVETSGAPEALFDDIADQSALEQLISDEAEAYGELSKVEEILDFDIEAAEGEQDIPVEDKTLRIDMDESVSYEPLQETEPEPAQEAAVSETEEQKVEEEPAAQEYQEPLEAEPPQTPPAEAMITGISEERIEAIIRQVVEDVVERIARETMAGVSERMAKEANEMVERVARETTTNVAEKIITDAISALKKSIESSTD